MDKKILDACCGSRMFWFDKENPVVVFMDNRSFAKTLCDGRRLEVKPDLIADFRPAAPVQSRKEFMARHQVRCP